ncbi:hypothetical protein F4677DRAFT_419526 [Hypoxylon crocopeplum]|nr:hypothetical protein F4677DRAFT_419526 [Hypoxylon crocopeplum]
MQNHHQDALLQDNNKYYFPPGTLAPLGQPGSTLRDEQGTPGLQPISHNEQKYAPGTGGSHDGAPPYRTHGAAHADEVSSQEMQTIPATEPLQLARSQPQLQSLQQPQQYTNQYHGQSFQTLPSPQLSNYSINNLTYSPNPATSNENQLNPYPTASPSSSWVKDESQTHVDEHVKVKRWVLWLVIGVVIILVGVGAVLGGVLGTRAEGEKSSNSGGIPTSSNTTNGTSPNTSPDISPNTSTSTPSRPIRSGSRLAVTGYRTETDYSIRLFFQDQDNQLRFSDKESSGANWTESTVLDSLPYQPMENGSIAAGSYLFDDPVPKLEFFYEDKDGIVRGQNFNFEFENGTIPLKGEAGSINTYPLQAAGGTISCFFPYIISQDADDEVRWTVMLGQNASNLSAPWWVNGTDWDVRASKGAGMVVLPIAQKMVNAGGMVYRSSEGMLSIKIRDGLAPSNDAVAWRKGALSKEIPNTALAAFSVGRPYDTNNQVNTYILYQDDDNDGKIWVVWQDDDSGWKGPETYDALDGADKDTDIACLTPGAYAAANIDILRDQDMNRCFFMAGGRVKEVWFDGTNWKQVNILPI